MSNKRKAYRHVKELPSQRRYYHFTKGFRRDSSEFHKTKHWWLM